MYFFVFIFKPTMYVVSSVYISVGSNSKIPIFFSSELGNTELQTILNLIFSPKIWTSNLLEHQKNARILYILVRSSVERPNSSIIRKTRTNPSPSCFFKARISNPTRTSQKSPKNLNPILVYYILSQVSSHDNIELFWNMTICFIVFF